MTALLLALSLTGAPALAGPVSGEVALPPSWTAGDATVVDAPWWKAFGDPALDQTIADALAGNQNLEAAWGRVLQARAIGQTAMAPLLPQLSFDGATQLAPSSALGFGFGVDFSAFGGEAQPTYTSSSLKFNGAMALDPTGRDILGVQAASNDRRAAEGDRDATALAVTSSVASAWFDLALNQQRVTVIEAQIQANRDVLEIAEMSFARSAGTGLDVLQQRQQLAAVQSQLPLARASVRVAHQQLAILTGKAPGRPLGLTPGPLPEPPARAGTGTPKDLVRWRPDLRAGERRLTSARQRRQAAERAFFPSFAVNANAGWQYFANGETTKQFNWGVGASFKLRIFDAGLSIAKLRQQRAAEMIAGANQRQATLSAMGEVESALILEDERRARFDAVRAQTEAAGLAWTESKRRYAEGIAEYLNVLAALSAWQNAELSLLQAHRDVLTSRIDLQTALGGSWTTTLSTRVPEGAP